MNKKKIIKIFVNIAFIACTIAYVYLFLVPYIMTEENVTKVLLAAVPGMGGILVVFKWLRTYNRSVH